MKKNRIGIMEAKKNLTNYIRAMLLKDKEGNYVIPSKKRQPPYLYSPPGCGKTQIVEEIASEIGIGFVSYSLTHMTRNQLLGLPVVSESGGEKCTNYTVPEIIAAVREEVRKGKTEGILHLDEFNCVSDTIMPAMLGFLQTGVIGQHRLPEGWVIVLCGNPPEYNHSARELDTAIIDRLHKIIIEPSFEDFMEYARERSLHTAVIEYLCLNKGDLYSVGYKEETADERNRRKVPEAVTPRGWENLSRLLSAYEEMCMCEEVDVATIYGYLKSERIAASFYSFYQEFGGGIGIAHIHEILESESPQELIERYSKKDMAKKRLDLAMRIPEYLEHCAGQGDTPEMISEMLSTLIRFVSKLPSSGGLMDRLMTGINESEVLMEILMKVKNEEYLKLCGLSYGIKKRSA
ncbi:MAG: AAA family ATPase [Lachnospiraceae bacterium]|nr:AAA family ATPase [Lachnospiraceae bacterium]